MLGAGVLALEYLFAMQAMGYFILLLCVRFFAAFISGYLAVRWLIAYLSKHFLYILAVYCSLADGLILFL